MKLGSVTKLDKGKEKKSKKFDDDFMSEIVTSLSFFRFSFFSYHTIALSKGIIMPKNADFLKKNAAISKIKRALVVKGIFSEKKHVCTYVQNLKFLA